MIELKNYNIENLLDSKKHLVYIVTKIDDDDDKKYIYKDYCGDFEGFRKEIEYLKILADFPRARPKLIETLDGAVVREYIEGKTLEEKLNRQEEIIDKGDSYVTDSNFKIIINLLEWLNQFYIYMNEKLGEVTVLKDIELNNFIIGKNTTYVDYSCCEYGEKEQDAAKIISEVLTLKSQVTTWRMFFSRQLYFFMVNSYGYDRRKLTNYLEVEIENIKINEGIFIPPNIIKSITNGFF